MPQYACIPYDQRTNLQNPETYPVRIAKYLPGMQPDEVDSNGNGLPNVLELESSAEGFTQSQNEDITALGGMAFADAAAYLAHQATL